MAQTSVSASVCTMAMQDDLEDPGVVERDPTGQYVRFEEVLGGGALKTVYKAFDEADGIEVAWNQVKLPEEIMKSDEKLARLSEDANLLKSWRHQNIVRCYHSWVDVEKKNLNMITELFTSGSLGQYRKKHNLVDNKAIKRWARQILKGLDYLHSQNPPIVHGNLKCENIFVNGNSGKVKIGDLGLATVLQHANTRGTGSLQFTAPERHDGDSNQLADIYSFGMCMLQMVTKELPYSECHCPEEVHKKVLSGQKPDALTKVNNPQVRQLIERCLAPVPERPAARDLLEDPFLDSCDSSIATCSASLTESLCPSSSLVHSMGQENEGLKCEIRPNQIVSLPAPVELVKASASEMKGFALHGKMEANDAISMTLWITDLEGHRDRIDFQFCLQTDTAVAVTEEMIKELQWSIGDAALIHGLMEELIAELVPRSRCCLSKEEVNLSQIASFSESNTSLLNAKTAPKVGDQDTLQQPTPETTDKLDSASPYEDSASRVSDSTMSTVSSLGPSDDNQNPKQEKDKNLDGARKGATERRPSFMMKLLFHCRNNF